MNPQTTVDKPNEMANSNTINRRQNRKGKENRNKKDSKLKNNMSFKKNTSFKRGMSFKSVKYIIVLLCITGIFISGAVIFSNIKVKHDTQVNRTVIINKIDKLSELAILKYNYSSIVALKDNIKLQNISIPFTGKSFIVKYNGYIKLGVDLKDKDINVIDDNKRITIKLKDSKVLDNSIDMESLMVYDEKYSIFNRYTSQSIIDEIAKDQKKTEDELIKSGYLKQANEIAKTLIEGILSDMKFQSVKVEFSHNQ